MSVADRVDVRAHGVEQQMHGELGRKFALTGELAAFQIGHHQIPRFKHPLIHAGGGGEDAASSRRTEMFPSQATMKPRSYIHLPAVQISRRCCSSVFRWLGPSKLVFTARNPSLPGT